MCSESEIDSSVSVVGFIRTGHVFCCCLSLAVSIKNKVSIMAAMIDRYPKIGDFSHSLSHRSGPLVVFYVIFILCPVCSVKIITIYIHFHCKLHSWSFTNEERSQRDLKRIININ